MADTLTGYAIVWNRWSLDLGGFRERSRPGDDAPCATARPLWSHRPDELLARLSAGTLRIEKDAHGLATEISLPTSRADIAELVQRRDVTGMSFGFMTLGDLWEDGPQMAERTITDMLVREVSPVAWPAYPQTSISLRQALAPGSLRKSSPLRLRPWTVTARLQEPMEHRALEYAMARDGEGAPVVHGEARRSLERYLEAKRKAGAPPEARTAGAPSDPEARGEWCRMPPWRPGRQRPRSGAVVGWQPIETGHATAPGDRRLRHGHGLIVRGRGGATLTGLR
jgi:HK97 family phage prohead protease